MTVRVTVKTHGCPTTVTVEGQEPVRIDHHQDRTFDVSGNASISIAEEEPSADHGMGDHLPLDPTDVPGRAQNDELLAQGADPGDQPRTGDAPPPQTGRGRRPLQGEPPADASAQ
jgi:hypothetical protein